MKNYDRSLEEVWEWKELVYQDVKGLAPADYLVKIARESRALMQEHGLVLRTHKRERIMLVSRIS
jgi:hypothetical protein